MVEIVTNFSDPKALVEDNTEVLYIDNSTMRGFRSCKRFGQLSSIRHLAPKKPANPLVFGSAIHKAHETYFKATHTLPHAAAGKAALEAMVKDLEENKAQLPRDIENDEDERRSIERGKMLFLAHVERWKDEPLVNYVFNDKRPVVEVPFGIDLGVSYKGRPIIFVGKIDQMVTKIINNTVHNIELKTTTQGLTYFLKQCRPNHQVTTYHIAAMELLGIQLESTIWDAIFISSRKPDKKKGGWFEYGIDFEKDFDRIETRRSIADIENWYADTRIDAVEYFRYKFEESSRRWQQNDSFCHKYGGCRYRGICEKNGNEAFIQSEFTQREWRPWDALEITPDDASEP